MSQELIDILIKATGETLYMLVLTTIIALIVGIPIGILFAVTEKDGIHPLPQLNKVVGTIINVVRSIPEIILIVLLLPIARLIVGTSLGTNAAIVPLSIGAIPFISRIVESSLKEVEHGKIEAAQSMGASTIQIIIKVLIPEALPSIIRGVTIGIIGILGFTAIAGAIGAGGLGSMAIRFGYQRFRTDVLIGTVVVLVLIVQIIQISGDLISKHINKKRFKFE